MGLESLGRQVWKKAQLTENMKWYAQTTAIAFLGGLTGHLMYKYLIREYLRKNKIVTETVADVEGE